MIDNTNKDDVLDDNTARSTKDTLRSNLFAPKPWQRLIYMLVFAVLLHVASLTMWVLVALQFLFSLFTGKDNADLRSLGAAIGTYIHQALDFLTYTKEEKPFPFSPWPDSTTSAAEKTALVESVESDSQS